MFHKRLVHLHIRVKEKLQNVPRFETDFLLNFDMFSSAFTCVNGSVHENELYSKIVHKTLSYEFYNLTEFKFTKKLRSEFKNY